MKFYLREKLSVVVLLLPFAPFWKAIKNSAESILPKSTLTLFLLIKLKKNFKVGLHNIIPNVPTWDHMECGKNQKKEMLMV